MSLTTKYEFEKTDGYGTVEWNTIYATNFEKIDEYMMTYIRAPVLSGESIAEYEPMTIQNGGWVKAKADGTRQPAIAIAISGETMTSGEYVRGQRIGFMTNSGWSFAGSGEVVLGYDGGVVAGHQVSGEYRQVLGIATDVSTIFIQL